jgi:hypothetical protein
MMYRRHAVGSYIAWFRTYVDPVFDVGRWSSNTDFLDEIAILLGWGEANVNFRVVDDVDGVVVIAAVAIAAVAAVVVVCWSDVVVCWSDVVVRPLVIIEPVTVLLGCLA